jgi:putative DNA primase/helicase
MAAPISAAQIASALGGKRIHSDVWICRCPVPNHGKGQGDKNPSLSIKDYGDHLSFVCFAGCSRYAILDALKRDYLWRGRSDDLSTKAERDVIRKAEGRKNIAGALSIWNQTVRARGTLVEKYLNARGIILLPDALRFHPALLHAGTQTRWPAMVTGVFDIDGLVTAIHRTYLARDGSGKAPINPNKMTLGPCRGNAIRLAPAAPSLMVGEGIETTLSVMQVTARPAWAAGSAGFMEKLVLPAAVKEVMILADSDCVGQDAARRAAKRWKAEKRRVLIAKPPQENADFNDLLRAEGVVR